MIQLRIKTEYTFGKTFAPVKRVVERLQALDCTAAGIVDTDGTWGHVPFFEACKAAGIQPLLGFETTVSDDAGSTPKMWFLATTSEALKELYQYSSLSHQQKIETKFAHTPRLYKSDVRRMSAGILKFAGEVLDEELLVEVGAHLDLSPMSRIVNAQKRNIAQRTGLKLVSVSDNAYAYPEDKATFQLVAKNAGKATPQWILEQLDNQDTAATISAQATGLALNIAPMVRAEGDLEAICRAGIEFRGLEWNEVYEQRMQYELELIRSKDFESYFIIVADMVHYAKQHMLVGPSRGSAAGSLVCYLARITEIDPIPPKLYFERFIDVSRTDLPDIDLDFPDNKRHMVFDYMAKKYGSENVAHIGTVTQFKPKSALVQVCKALAIPPAATAAVKVAMIERSSADSRANNCLEDTLKETDPGRQFMAQYPEAAAAALIEGHASHTGVHAAGLLVCNEPISDFCTVTAEGIAQVEKISAEKLGLLKIDVLGLRTLGILEDSGIDVDWYALPFDDPATYDVFNRGQLCGIFQFEGNALRAISKEVKFETIVEIDAVTALARPGPFGGGVTEKYIRRKKGERYQPIHPLVESHMSETYGLPVYQEQTLAIVREIGKFDWKETSTIRKAMSKRMGKEFFETYWGKFRDGAATQGIGEPEARATWETINAMGAWQMNKAHTFSYAVISYWTAWLKAHHPLEFAAANLRNAKDEDSAIELLREMVREGLDYVPFDLELSEVNWSAKNGKLVAGFMALKGIGDAKATKLLEARNAGKLTAKDRDDLAKRENLFADIFPFARLYGDYYTNGRAVGLAGSCVKIDEIPEGLPHKDERLFIGELIYKNPRNANEEVNVKKRGGKMETGQLEFLDLRLRDDSGTIGGRISRFDYLSIGKELLETVPLGSHLLVRAKFFNGIRYAFISKWRLLK